MLAAQYLYGLDGERHWVGKSIALGRRITKLVPEDDHDAQPLQTPESSLVLVADLRLDNREELATELSIAPSRARTMCDAALLLAAFERWDDDCCFHLVGDYAFAVWDGRAERLVLARDILGSRPLHYHRGAEFFAFASMPKGLHALPYVPYAVDEERIAEYLALLPQYGSRSFFQSIERVEPGHIVTLSRAGLHKRRHWCWERRTLSFKNADDYVEALRHHLDTAVHSQLRGVSGQVAASLSGGFDSSAVVSTAARLLAPLGGRVCAITAVPRTGYNLPPPARRLGDEGPLAATTAANYANIERTNTARHP